MILIISTCAEPLHETEFVKPIEKILNQNGFEFVSKHYKEINERDIESCDKVIISGTSLEDYEYLKDISLFFWLKNNGDSGLNKPVLGICAGMQIMGLVYGGKTKKEKEIGFYKETFSKGFLGIKEDSEVEVYHLHNNYITKPKGFEIYSESYPKKVPQAIKHKINPLYGVLFHPEVRNKEIIEEFVKL